MNKLVKLLACIATSCATAPTPPPTPLQRIDPTLSAEVENFYLDCKRLSPNPESCAPRIKLTVQVKDLSDPVWGVCYTYAPPYEYVRIVHMNRDTTLSPSLLKLVLYHELLHCVLGYEHYNDFLDVMNSSVDEKTADYVVNNLDYFLSIVFTREEK
jgi:hypothetical protein